MKLNKDFKQGFYWSLGIIATLVLLTSVVVGANAAISKNWVLVKRATITAVATSQVESNTVTSRANGRFLLTTPEKSAVLFLNVTTNLNKSYVMGAFELSYRTKEDIETGRKLVDVVYKVPENWLIENATDFNITAAFKMRHPAIKSVPRRDPRFFRGKDYPETIPFDEIEITTDFVNVYTDTNETEYNFIVDVLEKQNEFNIRSVEILIPHYETLVRG